MIKIGIDGTMLHGNLTGIGRYVFELCREIDILLPDAQFFIYSNKAITMPVYSSRWISRHDHSIISRHLKRVLWLKTRCGKLCKEDSLDFFWGTSIFLPTLNEKIRSIVTVYDLNYKIVPETMAPVQLVAHELFFSRDVRKANVVTSISQGTAYRLRLFSGRETDAVIYPGADPKFCPQLPEKTDAVLKKYAIKAPYILNIATKEPRKNIELLVDVFSSLKKDGLLPDYSLILAGTSGGWQNKRLFKKLWTLDGFVKDLGYVPGEDLPGLYSGAEVFVFPSLYEGFGMPVFEARKCGTRVVATDIPEIREAGDESTVYVPPSPSGIRNGILSALSFNKSVTSKAFSWKQSAELFVKTIRASI